MVAKNVEYATQLLVLSGINGQWHIERVKFVRDTRGATDLGLVV